MGELEKLYDVAGKLGFVFLAGFVLLKMFGKETKASNTQPTARQYAGGGVWAVPVTSAQSNEDALSYPAAQLF